MLECGVNPKLDFSQDVIGKASVICPKDARFVFAAIGFSSAIFSCNLEYLAKKLASKLTVRESKFM
jgi:siderophore synthetase component